MSEPTPTRRTFTLTLEAIPTGPPAEIRLRRLLKIALRYLGLRCTTAREETPPGPDAGERSAIGMTGNPSPESTREHAAEGTKRPAPQKFDLTPSKYDCNLE